MKTEVTTVYLEILTPPALKPGKVTDLTIVEAQVPCPELNRFLYTAVGGNWYWCDRLSWTYQDWLTHLSQDTVQTWVGYSAGNPAGYFELKQHRDRSIEILCFGLLPQFVGRGYGGHLLTTALQTAWGLKPERVWVHTCSLDGP
ncbi:MAG: GNAT family N-acetyltransferase, partial [Cyanobacteria bacterium J06659_2]